MRPTVKMPVIASRTSSTYSEWDGILRTVLPTATACCRALSSTSVIPDSDRVIETGNKGGLTASIQVSPFDRVRTYVDPVHEVG